MKRAQDQLPYHHAYLGVSSTKFQRRTVTAYDYRGIRPGAGCARSSSPTTHIRMKEGCGFGFCHDLNGADHRGMSESGIGDQYHIDSSWTISFLGPDRITGSNGIGHPRREESFDPQVFRLLT